MTTLVQGTAVVWLPVTDIDRSLGFYRDTLGLTEKQSDGDWAQLDANGVGIGLNAASARRATAAPSLPSSPRAASTPPWRSCATPAWRSPATSANTRGAA